MNPTENLRKALQKELASVEKAELKLQKKAEAPAPAYKEKIESKIPDTVLTTLKTTFAKAFGIVFSRGTALIEKGINKENLSADFDVYDYAVDKKGSRKELKQLRKAAKKSDFVNLSVTTAEGVGLGALGIGLPDIVLFIGMILKGVYEVSLRYGYNYDTPEEQYFILTMLKTALSQGTVWHASNTEVDRILSSDSGTDKKTVAKQMEETAETFATDMLVLKFIQGLPIVGVLGGMFNPVYYRRILTYVSLKYHKRYLLDKLSDL
ncbi:MAG: EcsC family protein [Clostridia bacterium]|nr:EcsC family protein [Clostridia bacterium]